MPYVKKEERWKELEPEACPVTVGQLNYAITKLILRWIKQTGAPSYIQYNSAIGVLECVKLELYRRKIAEYEDGKAVENGDIF